MKNYFNYLKKIQNLDESSSRKRATELLRYVSEQQDNFKPINVSTTYAKALKDVFGLDVNDPNPDVQRKIRSLASRHSKQQGKGNK